MGCMRCQFVERILTPMEFYSILNLDIQFSCLGVYSTYLGELVVTILEFEFGSVQLVLENIAASR